MCVGTCFLCKLVGFFLCFCGSWAESVLLGLHYVLHWAAAEICFCSHTGLCFILWVALVCSDACLFAFSTWSLVLSSRFSFPLGCVFTVQLSFVSHHCNFLHSLSSGFFLFFCYFAFLVHWFLCIYLILPVLCGIELFIERTLFLPDLLVKTWKVLPFPSIMGFAQQI